MVRIGKEGSSGGGSVCENLEFWECLFQEMGYDKIGLILSG